MGLEEGLQIGAWLRKIEVRVRDKVRLMGLLRKEEVIVVLEEGLDWAF